jgi:hypothetical protein
MDSDMSEFERDTTLRSVLLDAAKSGERIRFFGPGMMIVAEGQIAFVGEDIVGIRHGKTEDADEFVCIECIIKLQTLGEYRQY